jgi:hypothetical protein
MTIIFDCSAVNPGLMNPDPYPGTLWNPDPNPDPDKKEKSHNFFFEEKIPGSNPASGLQRTCNFSNMTFFIIFFFWRYFLL